MPAFPTVIAQKGQLKSSGLNKKRTEQKGTSPPSFQASWNGSREKPWRGERDVPDSALGHPF